jgi:transcription elongation factor GreA
MSNEDWMRTPFLPRRLPVTRRGRLELATDLAWLGNLRREILAERQRSVGLAGQRPADWARLEHELAAVDDRICRVRLDLATSFLLEDETQVGVGSEATVVDEWGEATYTIVGQTSASLQQRRIAYDSPLARALLGRGVGDEVEVTDSGGSSRLRIVGVRALPNPGVPAERGAVAVAVS